MSEITPSSSPRPSWPVRIFTLAYAGFSYVAFLVSFTLFALAGAGLWMPWEKAEAVPLGFALGINAFLVFLFAAQHTVMARSSFKARWAKIFPAYLDRSTFVLFASLILLGLVFFWQPVAGQLWSIESPVLSVLLRIGFVAGFLGVVGSSFLIDHLHLFGLKQAWQAVCGTPPAPPVFREPWAYRKVRHPMMTSVLLMMWSTPTMSMTQALMVGLFSAYTLVGILAEERELAAELGKSYLEYRSRVRWRVLPKIY